jgi:hypothetical protein
LLLFLIVAQADLARNATKGDRDSTGSTVEKVRRHGRDGFDHWYYVRNETVSCVEHINFNRKIIDFAAGYGSMLFDEPIAAQ